MRQKTTNRPTIGERIKIGIISYTAGQVIGTSAYILQAGRFIKGPALSAGNLHSIHIENDSRLLRRTTQAHSWESSYVSEHSLEVIKVRNSPKQNVLFS